MKLLIKIFAHSIKFLKEKIYEKEVLREKNHFIFKWRCTSNTAEEIVITEICQLYSRATTKCCIVDSIRSCLNYRNLFHSAFRLCKGWQIKSWPLKISRTLMNHTKIKRKRTQKVAYLVLLNAPLRQESQNRCPQTETWTALRTGKWQIRHNKFSLTAGTKNARYPGIVYKIASENSSILPRPLWYLLSINGSHLSHSPKICVVWINFA